MAWLWVFVISVARVRCVTAPLEKKREECEREKAKRVLCREIHIDVCACDRLTATASYVLKFVSALDWIHDFFGAPDFDAVRIPAILPDHERILRETPVGVGRRRRCVCRENTHAHTSSRARAAGEHTRSPYLCRLEWTILETASR